MASTADIFPLLTGTSSVELLNTLSAKQKHTRRLLSKRKGKKQYQKWKTVNKKKNKCHGVCSICTETFQDEDWVIEGADGQFYHKKEFLDWIRHKKSGDSEDQMKDPNTGVYLKTYYPPQKKQKLSRKDRNNFLIWQQC